MVAADPTYDLQGQLESLLPGLIMGRALMDAGNAAYIAKGFQPLNSADVTGILAAANSLDVSNVPAKLAPTLSAPIPAALPPYPTKLPRFADSNPDPFDGWSEFGITSVPAR